MKRIGIVSYSKSWPELFRTIAIGIKTALKEYSLGIHHIGSTAIPGMAAKNVIDIQLTVRSYDQCIIQRLGEIGFIWSPHNPGDHAPAGLHLPDKQDLFKWFFRKNAPAVHLHVRQDGRFNHRYPLLCRDFLRNNPPAAKSYELIKITLAKHFADDPEAYYDIKDPVFDVIMAGAEIWAEKVNWTIPPSDV